MSLPLSVFIIALNEAERIGRTIDAIKGLSDDIIVVDSGSTDGTQAVAESHGARVIFNQWPGYGEQKRFGEKQCRYDWRLNLDADEVVTPSLNREIRALLEPSDSQPASGAYAIRIVDVMPGDSKPRLFAYAHKYIRLYHKDAGRYTASSVHDVVHLEPGVSAKTLQAPIHHFSIRDLGEQLAKYNKYTDALVADMDQREALMPTWRIFIELPMAFFKAYFLRRHCMRGTYGYLTAMHYAFFRHLRAAKCYEQRQKQKLKGR